MERFMARFKGTKGDDVLSGGAEDDVLDGGAGNDFLNGNGGSDLLKGGKGGDILDSQFSFAGADTLIGGDGDDLIHIGAGDTAEGGFGNDTFQLLGGTPAEIDGGRSGIDTANFLAAVSTDIFAVTTGIERWSVSDGLTVDFTLLTDFPTGTPLVLSTFSDPGTATPTTIIGSSFGENLNGYLGRDVLRGAGGDDRIQALDQDDVLEGGLGADILNGGAGADDFLYRGLNEGVDTVQFFVPADDDIGLSSSIPGAGGTFDFVENFDPSPAQADVFTILYNLSNGALSVDPDGTSAGFAPTQLATMSGLPDLTSADFFFF